MSQQPSESSTLRSRSGSQSRRSQSQSSHTNEDNNEKGKNKETESYRRAPPLPAVKGTLGGIDSPVRGHFRGSSVSTLRDEPGTPSTIRGDTEERKMPNPNAPVFRIDQTMRTCFEGLKLGGKEEIRRLFMA